MWQRLLAPQDRLRVHVDQQRRDISFAPDEFVFLKVSLTKGIFPATNGCAKAVALTGIHFLATPIFTLSLPLSERVQRGYFQT